MAFEWLFNQRPQQPRGNSLAQQRADVVRMGMQQAGGGTARNAIQTYFDAPNLYRGSEDFDLMSPFLNRIRMPMARGEAVGVETPAAEPALNRRERSAWAQNRNQVASPQEQNLLPDWAAAPPPPIPEDEFAQSQAAAPGPMASGPPGELGSAEFSAWWNSPEGQSWVGANPTQAQSYFTPQAKIVPAAPRVQAGPQRSGTLWDFLGGGRPNATLEMLARRLSALR